MQTGIIFDIKRYAIHDGPGIRTTVFFKGCPLRCPWCHNPEGLDRVPQVAYRQDRCIGCGECIDACPEKALALTPEGVRTDETRCRHCGACSKACPADARELVGKIASVREVLDIIKKDVPFFDTSGGGATFSGGEPLMQPEFLLALLQACGREEIHRAVDTTGYADTDTLMQIARHTDLFLYDLKCMDPAKHRRYTGVSNALILKNLDALSRYGIRIGVRIPLIPGINDRDDDIDAFIAHLSHLPRVPMVHILPYHDFQKRKYTTFSMIYDLDDVRPPSTESVRVIEQRFRAAGLTVEVGG
ncbi:MAG: glycyl-radical enzyme activating protein [Deltaproteobacteria bacterium]|nr:glycyl-radical enzyme activating protein [Deltaproteobacteria bacterium]